MSKLRYSNNGLCPCGWLLEKLADGSFFCASCLAKYPPIPSPPKENIVQTEFKLEDRVMVVSTGVHCRVTAIDRNGVPGKSKIVGYGVQLPDGSEDWFRPDNLVPLSNLAMKQTGHPDFYRILEEMKALHEKKAADYGLGKDVLANCRGSTEFGMAAWIGVAMRMNDKMTRLKSFAQKGSLANESVEDSLLDLANYSILALILYREASQS